MDNKLSELKAAAMAATPGPWFRSSVQFNGITTEATFITQGNKPHLASTSEKRDAIFIATANPAVVLKLLAELEAKDNHIAELEVLLDRNIKRAKKLGELLATPVRLPTTSGRLGVAYTRVIPEVIEAIRAAGFKVEGDGE